MPVTCSIDFLPITLQEMSALDYEVMRHSFTAHRECGCLCDESVYQARLMHLLSTAGIHAEREVQVNLTFRDFVKPLFLDVVVSRQAIYELKAASALGPAHVAQLLNYLFLTGAERGKLVNFRPASVESQFVNAARCGEERRTFGVDANEWRGGDDFRQMVLELVSDWGTGLDRALYHQALVYCLGGEEAVTVQLPMEMDGVPLGNQRFHLLSENEAFHVTTFTELNGPGQAVHFRKLLAPSPLRAMHWINIGRNQVNLTTVRP